MCVCVCVSIHMYVSVCLPVCNLVGEWLCTICVTIPHVGIMHELMTDSNCRTSGAESSPYNNSFIHEYKFQHCVMCMYDGGIKVKCPYLSSMCTFVCVSVCVAAV